MKKIIVFCLSVILSSASLFAQERGREFQDRDQAERVEQIIKDLNLNDDQAVELRRVESDFRDRMVKERENMREGTDREKMREQMEKMMNERNEHVQRILTDEQYRQYLEKQRPPQNNRDRERRN